MKQVQKAEEISNIAFGFMASKALFVALHCNLFSLLSNKSLSSNALARLVKVPENRISTICTALTSIGLLIRENGMYKNSIGANKYLVKGVKYDFGDYLRLQIDRQMYGFMQQLEGVVTNNMNEGDIDSYAKWMQNEKEALLYSESQHAGSLGPGLTLSRMIDFSKVNTLLDVAGGTGGFAIRLCEQYPNLNINKDIPEADFEKELGVEAGDCYHCHTGRCPVGVATQDPKLRKRLNPDDAALRVYNFLHSMTLEAQLLARACGKTNIHSLEPEDMAALTMEASALAKVPLAGTNHTVGVKDFHKI